jgi:hypothetical protein
VQDADDVILDIRSSGAIYYDANGLAAGGVTHIANVTAGLALTAADFVVVWAGDFAPSGERLQKR